MTKFKNRLTFVFAAMFILPAIASYAFADYDCFEKSRRLCSQSSVRANLADVEKVALQREESKDIKPYQVARLRAGIQKSAAEGHAEICQKESFRTGLSNTESAYLAREESKELRPCVLNRMKERKVAAVSTEKTTCPKNYVYGSVRANLGDKERAALKREE